MRTLTSRRTTWARGASLLSVLGGTVIPRPKSVAFRAPGGGNVDRQLSVISTVCMNASSIGRSPRSGVDAIESTASIPDVTLPKIV